LGDAMFAKHWCTKFRIINYMSRSEFDVSTIDGGKELIYCTGEKY
jgi:hypothetical protein